jgi:ATP-dependent exoDNAse (exonuclease V) beta subunit
LSKTLEIIQQSVANGFDYSDIVLLTRKTKNGVLLANFLTENNIPIISSETLLIQNASEVKFIITFLEAGVALVQAYVFTILLCIYIKDLYVAH